MSEIATWEPQGICEASGFKYPLSQLVRQWDGAMVHRSFVDKLRLTNVPPVLSSDNAPYGVPCDLRKLRGDLSQGGTIRSHLSDPHHIALFKNGHVTFLAPNNGGDVSAPALRHSIGDVVNMGPRRKMPWIHARRVVARVENAKSFNRAIMDFVRNPMGQKSAVVVRYNPVAFSILRATPQPAVVVSIFDSFCLKMARHGTEWLNPSLLNKFHSAVFACLLPLFHLLTIGHQEFEVNA